MLLLINNLSITFDGSAQEKVPNSYKVPLEDYWQNKHMPLRWHMVFSLLSTVQGWDP